MKTKCCGMKYMLAILAFALVSMGSGYLWHVFESAWNNDAMKAIWRPMDAAHWKWMPAAHALQAIIFVSIFCCLGKSLSCCPCNFLRGAKFGFKIWLITALAGAPFMFIVYNITMDVVMLCLVTHFITFFIGGAIASKILGNIWCCDEASACDTGAKKLADRTEFYVCLAAMIMGVQFFLTGFIAELIGRNSSTRNVYLVEKEI